MAPEATQEPSLCGPIRRQNAEFIPAKFTEFVHATGDVGFTDYENLWRRSVPVSPSHFALSPENRGGSATC